MAADRLGHALPEAPGANPRRSAFSIVGGGGRVAASVLRMRRGDTPAPSTPAVRPDARKDGMAGSPRLPGRARQDGFLRRVPASPASARATRTSEAGSGTWAVIARWNP